jgi:hypothetical protein
MATPNAAKQITTALLNPDKPMSLGGKAELAQAQAITPSKMFEDGGYLLGVVIDLMEAAKDRKCPKTADEFHSAFAWYMVYCHQHMIPANWAGVCAYGFGCSTIYINKLEHGNKPEIAEAIVQCKTKLSNFLAAAAMNGQLNPILFFHLNKVDFGAVETNVLRVELENNQDISQEEYARRLEILEVDNLND